MSSLDLMTYLMDVHTGISVLGIIDNGFLEQSKWGLFHFEHCFYNKILIKIMAKVIKVYISCWYGLKVMGSISQFNFTVLTITRTKGPCRLYNFFLFFNYFFLIPESTHLSYLSIFISKSHCINKRCVFVCMYVD